MGRECGVQPSATTPPQRRGPVAGDPDLAWSGPLEGWSAASSSRTLLGEQLVGGAEDIVWRNGEQAGIWFGTARIVAAAVGAAKDAGARAVGAVATGIGGTVDADDTATESAGQMKRSCVSSDAEGDAARERDQLRQSCSERNSATGGDGSGERLLAGASVDHHV